MSRRPMRSSRTIVEAARQLRREMTPAETQRWALLRRKQLPGLRFRRQHPLGRFILDFYCPEQRIAIELDGKGHGEPEQQMLDVACTEYLEAQGIRVLRFWNEQVFLEPDVVLKCILDAAGGGAPSSI